MKYKEEPLTWKSVLWRTIFQEEIAYDFGKCGVWRGSSSILSKAVLKAYSVHSWRVHLVDSLPRYFGTNLNYLNIQEIILEINNTDSVIQ